MKYHEDAKLGIALVGMVLLLGFWEGFFFRHALNTLNERTLRLINQTMGNLLIHTHRMNDDLTMQRAVQSLAQGTGVLFATVVDTHKKVIAHSDPSLLGQNWDAFGKRSTRSVYSIWPLKEGTQPWGYLIFALSKRPIREKTLEHVGVLLSGNLCLLLGIFWLWRHGRVQCEHAQTQIHNNQRQYQELEQRHNELSKQHEISREISRRQIETAIEFLPQAALYLDSSQRVLAINQSARHLLQREHKTLAVVDSWQDIPCLENCGAELQRSLEAPGEKIETSVQDASVKITFLSDVTAESTLTGTWVFLN